MKFIKLFGWKVDIVTKNGLKPRIRDRILAEAIYPKDLPALPSAIF
ncbi:hypothetical protein [Nostoc sp.]